MTPLQITPALLRSWGACYDDARIAAIYGGRESLTPSDVLDLDIPAEDRLWVVLRPEILPEPTLRLTSVWHALRVRPLYERVHPGDPRVARTIEIAEAYARGAATAAELDTAWAARDAWDAAGAAAWAAWAARDAWDAAGAAAWAAARAAARAAAWDASAARDAAWDAWDAARDAAWAAGDAASAAASAARAAARDAAVRLVRAILAGELDIARPVSEWPALGWPEAAR